MGTAASGRTFSPIARLETTRTQHPRNRLSFLGRLASLHSRKAPPATGERIVGGAKNRGLNGLIQKQSFFPSGGDMGGSQGAEAITPIHIKTAVYLDGRIIGEVVSSELARLSTFPRQAAYSDPYVAYAAPDYNSLAG